MTSCPQVEKTSVTNNRSLQQYPKLLIHVPLGPNNIFNCTEKLQDRFLVAYTCFQMRRGLVVYPAIWRLGSSVARFNWRLKKKYVIIQIEYLKKKPFGMPLDKKLLRLPNYLFGHRRRRRLGPRHRGCPSLGTSSSPRVIGLHVLRTQNIFLANIFSLSRDLREMSEGVHWVSYSPLSVKRWQGAALKGSGQSYATWREEGRVSGSFFQALIPTISDNSILWIKNRNAVVRIWGMTKIFLALWPALEKLWRHKARRGRTGA